MVLYVTKYNFHPDKFEAFEAFYKAALPQMLAIPGLVEVRSYVAVSGSWQIVQTLEFTDMTACANLLSSETYIKMNFDLHSVATDINHEIWGPSPSMPTPLRPG